jgi:hypothetical protein
MKKSSLPPQQIAVRSHRSEIRRRSRVGRRSAADTSAGVSRLRQTDQTPRGRQIGQGAVGLDVNLVRGN